MTFFYSCRISLLELDFFKSCCFICQCSSFVHQLQVQWHSTNFYIELTFVVYLKVFKFCFVLLKNFTLFFHTFLGVFFVYPGPKCSVQQGHDSCQQPQSGRRKSPVPAKVGVFEIKFDWEISRAASSFWSIPDKENKTR